VEQRVADQRVEKLSDGRCKLFGERGSLGDCRATVEKADDVSSRSYDVNASVAKLAPELLFFVLSRRRAIYDYFGWLLGTRVQKIVAGTCRGGMVTIRA